MATRLSFTKIDQLVRSTDYVQSRYHIYSVLLLGNPMMICLEDTLPTASGSTYTSEVTLNAKGKSTNVLCISDITLAKTCEIVDKDDRLAKMFWDDLACVSTMLST